MNHKLLYLFPLLFLLSCGEDDLPNTPITPSAKEELNISPSNPPFPLDLIAANFYKDISYGPDTLNTIDFFMPNDSVSSSLFIIVHGGGFVSGDKTQFHTNTFLMDLTNNLLSQNIAVASINYRLVQDGDNEGLIKSLNDSKRALQFMRFHASTLKFNKEKVVMLGSSAGGGTVLWIGLNDDMADPNQTDPILQESTRIQGLIATSAQSNYDFMEWHNNVFSTLQADGFDQESIIEIMSESTIFKYFGVSTYSELLTPSMIQYRNSVNMLSLLSSDDPEIYIATSGVANSIPTNTSELYHHPLHIKALQEKADLTNTMGIFYCPELGIDTRNGENTEAFILRKIGQ